MLPIPAVQGGAVENLIDFYLEYNDTYKLYDITVYSPWNDKITNHPALLSDVNNYVFIDVTSIKARIARKLRSFFHSDSNEYYNYFIEYYFEKVYVDLKHKDFDFIILENGAGLAYKLSQRGFKNIILHMHNEVREAQSQYHTTIFQKKSLRSFPCQQDSNRPQWYWFDQFYQKERTFGQSPTNRIWR